MIRHTGRFDVVLILLTVGTFTAFGQTPVVLRWEQIDKEIPVRDFYGCVFVDDSVVIAVGGSGTVRRGVPFKDFPVVAGQYGLPALRAIASDSRGSFVCGGDSGLLGTSIDSGKTWSFERYQDIGNVKHVEVESASTSIAASDLGLYRIHVSGETRQLLDGALAGASFAPGGMITAGFIDGRVSISADGGNTWTDDSELSSIWPIVKVVNDGQKSLIVHQRFITWRNRSGNIDTSYMPSAVDFAFTDLSIHGSSWWATGRTIASGHAHAYSNDSGLTWTVSNGFLIRAGDALATKSNRIFALGQRESFVYGFLDSAITPSYRLFGFQPASDERPTNQTKVIKSHGGSTYVLSEQQGVRVERYGGRPDTLFSLLSSTMIDAQGLWISDSRLSVIVDTSGSFETQSGWVTRRKFRIYTKGGPDTAFTIIDAPGWDLPVTTSYADEDGNLFLGCVGRPYVYRYTVSTRKLDSLTNIPPLSVEKIVGGSGQLCIVGTERVAFSQNGGESWQMQDSPLPWRSQNSVMSPTGRLFIARLDVSGTTRRLRIASSDDLGQSWQSRIDQQINGVISSLANFDASAGGRLILSGFGNTVLVSMDDGESIHELSTPTFNAATIYASTFSDNESIAIGGSTDILLRGILNSVSSVAERYCDDQGAILPYKYHSIVEYDLHGRILGSYYSAQALTLIEFLERTRSSAHGVRLLHCTNNDGAQSLVSLIR